MKNIGIVGLIMLLLMSCQSSDDGIQETWDVAVSRATTNGENILVVGKKNGSEQLRGILIPSTSENSLAQWQGTKPSWPGSDNLDMFVVSPVPDDGKLPRSISVSDGTIWMVDYLPSTYKPNKFTLEHLMAKLKVHIRINNNPNHKRPLNTQMALHTEADVDYPNKGLKNLSGRSRYNVSLGSFTEDRETDNWVSDELLILPQTLEKGKKCLRFAVSGGDEYTFSPDEELVLQAGKINHLYLGIAFDNLELILIGNGTSITDWTNGGSNNGEAVEN
jgi:hypothetical protein